MSVDAKMKWLKELEDLRAAGAIPPVEQQLDMPSLSTIVMDSIFHCKNCCYFCPIDDPFVSALTIWEGECRLKSPTGAGGFPGTMADSWCGEFKPKVF